MRLGHRAAGQSCPGDRSSKAERSDNFFRALKAAGRVLCQQAVTQAIVNLAQLRTERRRRRRIDVDHVGDRLEGRGTGERAAAGQALVEDHAKRKQIAAAVDGPLEDLFWRHVCRCADDPAFRGHARDRRRVLDHIRGRDDLGDAEVQQLGPAGCCHDDVARLEIPVNHPVPVRDGQGFGNVQAQVERAGMSSGPASSIVSSVSPSTYCITMQSRPSVVGPASYTVQMPS